jgi:hypothetical protein
MIDQDKINRLHTKILDMEYDIEELESEICIGIRDGDLYYRKSRPYPENETCNLREYEEQLKLIKTILKDMEVTGSESQLGFERLKEWPEGDYKIPTTDMKDHVGATIPPVHPVFQEALKPLLKKEVG